MAVTNKEFAETVGCDYTTASRLRNGRRMPSTSMLSKIERNYHIPAEVLLDAYDEGPKQFSALLRSQIFDK